jgi:hypothetical protein
MIPRRGIVRIGLIGTFSELHTLDKRNKKKIISYTTEST